jgi:hypothetical protein
MTDDKQAVSESEAKRPPSEVVISGLDDGAPSGNVSPTEEAARLLELQHQGIEPDDEDG